MNIKPRLGGGKLGDPSLYINIVDRKRGRHPKFFQRNGQEVMAKNGTITKHHGVLYFYYL